MSDASPKTFPTDITSPGARTRKHLRDGADTPAYGGDRKRMIEIKANRRCIAADPDRLLSVCGRRPAATTWRIIRQGETS